MMEVAKSCEKLITMYCTKQHIVVSKKGLNHHERHSEDHISRTVLVPKQDDSRSNSALCTAKELGSNVWQNALYCA